MMYPIQKKKRVKWLQIRQVRRIKKISAAANTGRQDRTDGKSEVKVVSSMRQQGRLAPVLLL